MKKLLGRIEKTWMMFLAAAVLVLALPALLTQTAVTIFNFSQTGQVGDTIGGITAPFIGLLSAYLIYKAFIVQVESNKIQSKNNEFGIALKLIEDLEYRLTRNIHRYEYSLPDGKSLKSENANLYEIIRFWNGMIAYRNSYMSLIAVTIRQVNYFKKFVERSSYFTQRDKTLLMEKAALTFGTDLFNAFDTHIKTTVDEVLSDQEKEFFSMCKRFHDTTLQDFLFHLIDLDDFN